MAAMTLAPFHLLRDLTAHLDFVWDMAPVPVHPGDQRVAPATAWGYAIAATSGQREAAWQFVRFAAGPDGAAAVARAGGVPGYNTPAIRQAWFEQRPAPPAGTESLFHTAWTIFPRATSPEARQILMALYRAANRALSGATPWDAAHAEYVAAVRQIRTGQGG